MCKIKQGSTTCGVAIWFGAHVALTSDWTGPGGDGRGGAGGITGSPYHVSLDKVDGASAGSRDNQMQAGALGGTIVITKNAIPDSAQNFEFSLTGQSNFFLDDDSDPALPNTQSFDVPAGNYTAVELAPATGWSLTGLTCTDPTNNTTTTPGTRTAAINLGSGETVSCTYTNTQAASITIVKDAIPDGPTDFAFTDNIGDGCVVGPLDDDGDGTLSNQVVCNNVTPGDYTVTETAISGWKLTGLACSGDLDDGGETTLSTREADIDLDPGESITCTFTNSKLPTIVVRKITTGIAGGPFTFTTTGAHGFTTPFDLTTVTPGVAVQQSFEIDVIGGNFTVTESTVATGFVPTDVDCAVTTVGDGGTTATDDLATVTGTITGLAAGATVTCTFINSGVGTTRTQGFWGTHLSLVQQVWSASGGTIGGITTNGMTVGERTLCGQVLTVPQVMGGFWSNISRETDGTKRSKLDQARMQLLQQLLAAILNNQLFGSVPSGMTIDQAKAAFCTGTLAQVKAAQSAMASFNEAGDSGIFTPGASADPKAAKLIADLEFWDDLP
jgi:hypothetical protein